MTNQKYIPILLTAALLYLFVALQSSGYYHWDEHYQIVEFANFKMGNAAVEDLAWEYKAGIRPALQPAICFVIFKSLNILGITNSYLLALSLRLVTATLAIFAIHLFITQSKKTIKPELWPYFILLSFGLWFLPFINVRFSAESWSGLFLLIGISLILSADLKATPGRLLLFSLFLGTAILFKYQTAIAVAGLLAWLACIEKLSFRKLIAITLCITSVLALGALVDSWLYGKYVFTLYNYFHVNLIEGVAAKYGTAPWYEIIIYIVKAPGMGIGSLLLFAVLYLTIKKPKNVVIWAALPYLVVHAIISHKELRFLFPLANLCPFILVYAYQLYAPVLRRVPKLALTTVGLLLLCTNLVLLFYTSTKSAGRATNATLKYIYDHYKDQPIHLIGSDIINPYREFVSPKNTFYLNPKVSYTPIQSIWRTDLSLLSNKAGAHLLLVSAAELTGPMTYAYLEKLGYHPVHQNISRFHQFINDLFEPKYNAEVMTLFEKKQMVNPPIFQK